MKLKTLICIAFCAVASFAFAEKDEHTAYVEALYSISAGDKSILTIGDETFEVYGASIAPMEMSIYDAVDQYYPYYQVLGSVLGQSGLNKTIRAYTLAKWAEVMTAVLYNGFAQQEALNQEYADMLNDAVNGQTEALNEAQTQALERIKKTEDASAIMNDAIQSVSVSLRNQNASMSVLATETKAELESVNSRISELSSQVWITDDEKKELANLKSQAEQLSVVEAAARKAANQTQSVAAEIAALKVKVKYLSSKSADTNNWKAVSAWLGQKDKDERKNNGVFLEPAKVDTGSSSGGDAQNGNYNYKNEDTIFTMLEDLGVVPVVNDPQREAWKTLGKREPDKYFYIPASDRSGSGDKCFAMPKKTFPAPSNWVDGETITCTNGVYSASGVSWANAARSMGGFLNSSDAGELGEVAEDGALADDSLWSTNNVKNPANPNFDSTDMTNPWNKIRPKADAEISASLSESFSSGTRKSIDYWNKSNLGVAFSLYGFNEAENFCFPYLHSDWANNRELKWRPITVADKDELVYIEGTQESTATIDCEERTPVDEAQGKVKALILHGFKSATVGQVAYKKSENELGWTGGVVKIVGTDDSTNWPKDDTDAPAQTITFKSASDSNVKVTVEGDKTSATVTIGVYYK